LAYDGDDFSGAGVYSLPCATALTTSMVEEVVCSACQ
jgi:hypothetical protein